jgi:hypothetical protein
MLATKDSFQTEGDLVRDAGQASVEAVRVALHELLQTGRVKRHDREQSVPLYEALDFHIPVGSEQGWEAAVCDHFVAMSTALAAKLATARSSDEDVIGGATLRFRIHPDHPHQTEVRTLLKRTREQVGDLWRRVAAYNESSPPPEDCETITFYYGQNASTPSDGGVDPGPSDQPEEEEESEAG